jgi:hypothetical protein
MWFQPDIPNPGVDLSKLYDVRGDLYPFELQERLTDPKNGFDIDWELKIEENFENEELKTDRMFNNVYVQDQYQMKHIPMKFFSQITCPDFLNLDFLDHTSLESRERQILTLSEIAHFVR